MYESTDLCLRSTRSSIVRPVQVLSARRPSSAIPRLTEMIKYHRDDNCEVDNTEEAKQDSTIDVSGINSTIRTMNVYLRLKPRVTKTKRIKKMQDDVYVITDESNLLTKFPSVECGGNSSKKGKTSDITNRKFNFTKIFGSQNSQSEFFEEAIKQRIVEFLGGQNCSFMSYGTTNSGKTYTFHGNSDSPGIIPRSIEFIFSGINCTLSPWYKPLNLNEVVSLNENGRHDENEARENLLAGRSIDRSICQTIYESLENSMKDDRKYGNSAEAMYSVWISFVEIYNDNVYDLLIDEDNQEKLTPLRLVKDKHGRAFVQGLRMICATTGSEAYQIFVAGQSKLTVGSTNLNQQSSRSHSIFTIKLLRYFKEKCPEEVEVSILNFCDLAGTGRSRKSTAVGNELKEARNINTSLLVLGRCLKSVLDYQTSKQNVEVIGPFRESKLTRVFERALSGKEGLTLIVNVDQSPDLYIETLSVLNFSAIANKIVVGYGKEFLDLVLPSPKETRTDEGENRISGAILESSGEPIICNEDDINLLKKVNDSLRKEVRMLRESALSREYEIRKEMANLYSGIIKDLEANWRKRTKDVEDGQDDLLKWSVKQVESFYKERIDSLTNRKRRRTSGGEQKDDEKTLCEKLEAENSQITSKVIVLRDTVKKLKDEQEILNADKNKCVFELALVKDELKTIREFFDAERGEMPINKDNTKLVDDLRNFIDEKNITIKNLQESLRYAKDEYLKATRKNEKFDADSNESKNASILDTISVEKLQEELLKRIGCVSDRKELIQVKIIDEKSIVHEVEQEVDAKFSSSTFKTCSPRKYSLLESENSIADEELNLEDSRVSPRYSSIDPAANETTRDIHSGFMDTIDKVFKSTIEGSKNDSGIVCNRISCSTEKSLEPETEEKASQTKFNYEDNIINNQMIQERVEQLKLDHIQMKSEHVNEAIRISELSQELECIQCAIRELKKVTYQNEEKIIEYQEKLASREKDLSNLGIMKNEMEIKLEDVSKQLIARSKTYEKNIGHLRDELKICEAHESRTSKRLEECLEKTSSLESQLSVAHIQLDKTSVKCFTEHIPKIEKLEKELVEKSLRVKELDGKVSKVERDLERVEKLNEKVTDFSLNFDKSQSEKMELRRELTERLKTQSTLETELKRLTYKMNERENEITSLRNDLGNVVKMNMENSEIAKELSKEIVGALGRLSRVKGEIGRSEDERRKLERTSGREIGNLIARLADFEKNAGLLVRTRTNEDSRMDELDRLKLLLHKKDREMCFFKKNRDKTIRKYESLIKKLQADVEMRCHRESSELRMLYPKRAISRESLGSIAESLRWKTMRIQSVEKMKSSRGTSGGRKSNRLMTSDHCDHQCTHSFPSCASIDKKSSSQTFLTSSTSLEGSVSSESKIFPISDNEDFHTHEIVETESRTELNLNIVECQGFDRRNELSQTVATFSIPSTSDESHTDFTEIPEWMEIRRTNGKTHFRLRKGDSGIGSEVNPRI